MKKHLLIWCAAVIAATMSLNAQTIVINEGFEDGIQEGVWTQEFVSGQTPWMVEDVADGLTYPGTVVQGTKRAYLRNTTGETQGYVTRLVSQVMDLSPRVVYQPELAFWYANPRWSADRDTLRVLYRNNTKGQWKQLAEYSSASADWTKVVIELPEVGPTYQIAFEGKDNLGRGIVLDSILVRSAPECTVPHDLYVSNKGAGKINLAWVASWDAAFFEVLITKDTINPNELETVDSALIAYHEQIDGLYMNCDVTLEAGEYYYAYVRSLCGKETSAWSSEISKTGAYGFRVRMTKQIPFSTNFTLPSTVTDKFHDPDWSYGNNTGKPDPFIKATSTSKYSLDKSACMIFAGGTTSKPEEAIPAGSYVYMATPALADSTNPNFSIQQLQVHFWSTVYIYSGRTYAASIKVGVMTDPDDITTFRAVDTVTVWGNKTFQENFVDLSSYKGTGMYVAFVSDFDRQNLFYIDDVTIDYRPEVNKVTKISVNPRDTFATISWEGNADSYNVLITNAEVDPANPTASAVIDQATVTTNSYLCDKLDADHSWNRPYYVYVLAEGTEWSYRYPFVTLASQRAIPYSYTFESTADQYTFNSTAYPKGIGLFGNNSSYPYINSQGAYKGSKCLYLSMNAGNDEWITLPMVEDLDSTQVKFYLNSGSQSFIQAHAKLGVMTNPMDINTFVEVADFRLTTNEYTMCYANFEKYKGPKDGVIAIVWGDVMNMTQKTINYIDDIQVEKLSDCVPPANVDLEVYSDSVFVSLDEPASADAFEVVIATSALTVAQRDKSFAEIAALSKVVIADTVDTDEFGFGGLDSQKDYYLYVRTLCGYAQAWWVEKQFTTPCPDYAFPYKEDFNSYTTDANQAGCWELADYMGVGYPKIVSSSGDKSLYLTSSGTTHRSLAVMPTIEGELSDAMLTFETATYSSYGTSTSASVLYVGTIGDIRDYSTFVPFDTIRNTGSTRHKVKLILADYNLAHDKIAFSSGVGTLSMNSNVILDNVELRDASCLEMYDFKQTASKAHSVDFTWDGVTPNDQWELKIFNEHVTAAAVAAGSYSAGVVVVEDTIVTGKSFHLAGLDAVSTYYVYIRTLCGDSIWGDEQTVETACEMLDPTQPNKETFESYSSGTSYSANYQVPCWTTGNAGPDVYYADNNEIYPYVYKKSSYASSGTNTYRLHSDYEYDYYYYDSYDFSPAYVASPEIDCTTMTDLAVTFNMYASTSYSWLCGVMTNPNDIRTFVVLDSVKGTGESTRYTYDLNDYAALIPANARYFAWRTPSGGAYTYSYLDDVSILKLNCPLTKPTYSELTASSVRISSGLRTTDQWILIVSNQSLSTDSLLSPTYVLPESAILMNDTLMTRSRVVTGLASQTNYYVYTGTLCDGMVMQWSAVSFITPCGSLTPEEIGTITFDTQDGYVTGTSGYMPCWTVGSQTPGVSSSYIPYVDNSSSMKHNGNNYLKLYDYVYGTSSNYTGAYAIMPQLNVDSISKYQVTFWARSENSSSSNNQLIVGIVTDPSDLNTFIPVDTLTLSKTAWEPFSVGFENYWGDYMGDMGSNIMFLSDFAMTNYAYISEISVDLIPQCRPITGFTVDSVGEKAAVISWRGYQDSYRLLVSDRVLADDEKDDYVYVIDSVVNHSNHVRIEGLNPVTNYYIYAQGFCGKEEKTIISIPYASVRTACPIEEGLPLPFLDDFESYELNDMQPGCWQFLSTGSQSSYFSVKSETETGTQAIDFYSTSYNGSYAVFPKVNGNLQDLMVSFDARPYYSTSTDQEIYVGVMEDVNDPTTFVTLKTFSIQASSTFKSYSMLLAEYDLVYDNLVITSGIDGVTTKGSNDVYVDNIGLSLVSTCHAPKLTFLGSTANTISLQLTPAREENSEWEMVMIADTIYSKIRNIDRYLDTVSNKMTITETSIVLNELDPATTYVFYARTVCGEDEKSSWMKDPLKAHTQFYYKDSYFFGFEKTERWERSTYSTSDRYYLHPALTAGRDELSEPSTAYGNYPYCMENGTSNSYSHTGKGAMLIYSTQDYYGGYVIFPAVEDANDRSFAFKLRPGYLNANSMAPTVTYDGALEIGLIDKNTTFDTYEPIATIRVDKLGSTQTGREDNNYLYSYFTLDLDAATIADKQVVLHAPMQPEKISYLFIDDVTLDAPRGFSLVALNKVVADGESALVEWANVGGPWNLYIKNAEGAVVKQYLNLSNVTSQQVDGLEPRTDYTAVLEAVSAPQGTEFVTTATMRFTTECRMMEPDAEGAFAWNFDDETEYEPNDVLAGTDADTAYFKPSCFHVGITYPIAANGYQWLVQSKDYNALMSLETKSNRHLEVGREDSHAMRVFTSEANFNSYFVLPELNCDYDEMMIEFYMRPFVHFDDTYGGVPNRGKITLADYLGSEYSQSIVVGTLTDPKDFSTLQVIDTLRYQQTHLTANDNVNNDPTGLMYWELMQLPLTGAQGKYLVLFQPSHGLLFLDDLRVKPIGNTIFAPYATYTSEITDASATMSWQVHEPEIASVFVMVDANGVELVRDTIAGTTYTVDNLAPATTYQWYVYQASKTQTSALTPATRFVTECVSITPDYSCGFELAEGWQLIPETNYVNSLCWTYSDAQKGAWASASFDPYNMANTDTYRYSRTDSFAVVLRGSYSTNASNSYQPYIAMPAMDITAYDTLQVNFWMRPAYVRTSTGIVAASYTGSAYSKSIIVGTMTDPKDASTFVAIDTVTYDGTLSYADEATEANNFLFQNKKVELAGATGPYVAFMTSFFEKGSSTRKNMDYIWLDDISFSRRQECKDPKDLNADNVSANEATLSWVGVDAAESYMLQVSTDPNFEDPNAFVFDGVVEQNTYTVTGLKPHTTYVWRVQCLCGEVWGDSDFAPKASFTTPRSPYYLEEFTTAIGSEWTFSMAHADDVVDGTDAITSGTNSYSFVRTTYNNGLPGTHYVAAGYSNNYHWMITPVFSLPANDSVHFSMDIALTACNTSHSVTANEATDNDMKDDYYFMIIVSEDGGATWKSKNILAKWQNTNPEGKQLRDISSTGQKVRYSLAQFAGKNIRIGFYREAKSASNTGVAIHVDNVRLAYFDKETEYATGCQYEDVVIGDIVLPGDITEPGIHTYPTCFYTTDAEAKAGKRDSVYSIEIEIFPAEGMSFDETICEGETYTDLNFHGKDKSGVYRRKIESSHGCDSIITLNLTVIPRAYAEDLEIELCPGDTYMWNGKPYNRAGIYRDTTISAMGCDSIGVLIISYLPSEDTIRVSETITLSELPYSYEDPAHPYVEGETPIYYAQGTQPGVYKEIKMVQGTTCAIPLVHTLTVLDAQEGVDNIYGSQEGARKVIYRDQMYIIVNDEWYTPTGQKVADPRQ